MCGPLCDAVTELDEPVCDGQAYLAWLQERNLFTIPLDDQHHWLRYHHLFQQLLQYQLELKLTTEEIAALHTRASRWYAANGFIDEALNHALKAGDIAAAAQLVEQNGRTLLDEDQWHTLEILMAKLPDDISQQRPMLLLAKAWVLFHQFALWAIPPILEAVEAILGDEETAQPLWGEVDFFWGHHWYWQGQSRRSMDLLTRALERIPKRHHLARGEAELFWGLAKQMSGQKNEAVPTLNEWVYHELTPHPGRQINDLGSLVFIFLLSGELAKAAQLTQQVQDMVATSNNAYIKAWVSYLLANIHYCWNDLENASRHFTQAVEKRYIVSRVVSIDSLVGLTLTYQALDQPDKARAMMALLLEFAQEIDDPAYITIARSCQARLALLQGDMLTAGRWLQTVDLSSINTPVMFYFLETPQLTRCRVLIAQKTEASLGQAEALLQACRHQNEVQHNTYMLINILLLQALLHHKQSQPDKALAVLERAVTLGFPGGFIRPFVETGPELTPYLEKLRSQGVAPDYITQILKAFDTDNREAIIDESSQEKIHPSALSLQPLPEPLTDRELEVLALLAQRFSNKEIAAHLVISPLTVKKHTINIYQKLGVKNRRQAVSKATALGLVSDH
jgi:LuxR family maltose regulon positive regulatory protein